MPTNACTVRILDEVYCVFVGLHPDHIGHFYEKYGVFSNNYYFNPKFKLGTWDGKIRYFHKTGKTYVTLLSEIIPLVIQLGYKVQLDDQRSTARVEPDFIDKDFFHHIPHPITDEPWEMRPYQLDMVNALIANGGGVGIAGTGAGKTSMTAALAKAYENAAGFRSIIIVPDKNLTDQTVREYAYFGLDVGEFSGDRKEMKKQHVVSTWQSLQNNPNFIQEFQVIIVDEAHGLRGNVLTELLCKYGKDIPYRFGVTGTLPKGESDQLAVKTAVGTVQYTIPAHVLQDQGYLAKLQIDCFQHIIDFKKLYQEYLDDTDDPKPMTYRKFVDTYFPDYASEKRYLQGHKSRLEWIADYIIAKHELQRGNVLCLVDGVRFGKKLADAIPGAVFLSGKDKMKDRREVYHQFKDRNDVTLIATVQIASTGLDIPRIFNMISVDMGKSFIRVIQSIGRGLRLAQDKDAVHFTDICSDLKYSRKHLTERKKYYKEAKYPFNVAKVELPHS